MAIQSICASIFLHLVAARDDPVRGGPSGSGRISGDQCPYETLYDIDAHMVFSPFKPYWKFPNRKPRDCWVVSDCIFEAAGESRKLQFAATALVMGLIPLAIKDIAWPARRLVFVTKSLPWAIEALVLSLGLIPVGTGDKKTTRRKNRRSGGLAVQTCGNKGKSIKYYIAACLAAVILCFGMLVVMEVYSKRSALGCPVPIFIFAWHMIALVPGTLHSLFANSRRRRYARRNPVSPNLSQRPPTTGSILISETSDNARVERPNSPAQVRHIETNDIDEDSEDGELTERDRERKIASAIQGANEAWPVQMAWGIYYVAGTLVFTSIMAVTVPELVIWVIVSLATAACMKILAFLLCLSFEDVGGGELPSPTTNA
ncbi:hypothetical protein J1614_006698 [Plenodomus biglobosus]|nr:hypothetical protein J1614_006698 [Plenodomus biglobosus]